MNDPRKGQYYSVPENVSMSSNQERNFHFTSEDFRLHYSFLNYISDVAVKLNTEDLGIYKDTIKELLEFMSSFFKSETVGYYLFNKHQSVLTLQCSCPNKSGLDFEKEISCSKHPDYIKTVKDLTRIVQFAANDLKKLKIHGLQYLENVSEEIIIPLFTQTKITGILGFGFGKGKGEIVFQYEPELKIISVLLSNIIERNESARMLDFVKEKAEESEKLKTAFLTNLSHEIRTPMNGILGFSGILARMDVSEQKRGEYIQLIQNSGKQLLSIIDDIIDISKIDSNQYQVFYSSFDLIEFLENLYKDFSNQIANRLNACDLKLALDIGNLEGELFIQMDELMLKRVFSNLLDNAIKFTRQGLIEFGCSIKNNNELHFFVRDSGIGIPEDKKEIIFDRFRQADELETRQYGGTGLGLSISKAFVEKLGGMIWFESEAKKGTCFRFIIPYLPCDPVHHFQSDEILQGSWTGKTILIVDDNPDVHYYFKEVFEDTNATFYSVYDGGESLFKLLKENTLDIVLLDLQMPDFDGFYVCEKIKKLYPHLPVVIQTAYVSIEDQKKAYQAGGDGFVTKPIDKLKLFDLMNALFRND